MKRSVRNIVGYACCATILTIVVAVACAASNTSYAAETARLKIVTLQTSGVETAAFLEWTAFGSERIVYIPNELVSSVTGSGFRAETVERPPRRWVGLWTDVGVRARIVLEEAHGWPAKCLRWRLMSGSVQGGLQIGISNREESRSSVGSLRASYIAGDRVIPFFPIWSGFAINVASYAGMLFVLRCGLVGSRRVRILLRRGKGYCPQCTYNLRGEFSAGCPECGWRRKEKDAEQPA